MDRLVGPAPLQQVLAYPTDVGLAAASVLTGNLIHRYPKLRIAFSHGGGTLAMLLPRLQQAMSVFPALRRVCIHLRSNKSGHCISIPWFLIRRPCVIWFIHLARRS